jgi:hypothetical protein
MIVTGNDKLKKKYGNDYDEFDRIRELNKRNSYLAIQEIQEFVENKFAEKGEPTVLPSGKMRKKVWKKIAEIAADMGILLEPKEGMVDLAGFEEPRNDDDKLFPSDYFDKVESPVSQNRDRKIMPAFELPTNTAEEEMER